MSANVCGHLFSGRYKGLLVDGSGTGYLLTVCDYVHLNPPRAGILSNEQPLEDYPWSSYPLYLKPPEERPAWLRVDRVLGEAHIPMDSSAGRLEYARYLELRRREKDPERWEKLRHGWIFGSEEFKVEMMDRIASNRDIIQYGKSPSESLEHQAENIIKEELITIGWQEGDLPNHAKTCLEKLNIARRLRRETVMSLRWIARRLHMGSTNTLRNTLWADPSKNSPKAAIRSVSEPSKLTVDQPLTSGSELFDVIWD